MSNPTVPATAEGMTDWKAAFAALEDPISRAHKFTGTLDLLAEVADEAGTAEFHASLRDALIFISHETHAAVSALFGLHLASHNEITNRENAEFARQRKARARS